MAIYLSKRLLRQQFFAAWTSAVDSASAIVPAQNVPWLLKFHTHKSAAAGAQDRWADGGNTHCRAPYFTTSKLSDYSLSIPCRLTHRVEPGQTKPTNKTFGRPRSFFRHCRWRGVSGAVWCAVSRGGAVRTHCANVESRYSHSLCARLCRVGVGLHV